MFLSLFQPFFYGGPEMAFPNETSQAFQSSANATLPSSSWPGSSNPTIDLFSLLPAFLRPHAWLVLLLVGRFGQTFMSTLSSRWSRFLGSIFFTASFNDLDASYERMLFWLSKQTSWQDVREVEIRTPKNWQEAGSKAIPPGEQPEYIPSIDCTYSFWYRRRRISITRTQDVRPNTMKEDRLTVDILLGGKALLDEILTEAWAMYSAAQENKISIYTVDRYGDGWRRASLCAKRPLSSIILDHSMKSALLDDAKDFLQSKDWYADRGIPCRRGYLLYGAPGSGKTSLIHGIAGELGLDIYVISLSRKGMDDALLNDLLHDLSENCIALIEDIDAAFKHGVGDRDASDHNDSSHSRLSLSGLLNAIDGIGAQEGRILFATTNHIEALDSALIRPGRMDLHIEFHLASKAQAEELFYRFYVPRETPGIKDSQASTGSVITIEEDLASARLENKARESSSSPTALNSPQQLQKASKVAPEDNRWLASQFAHAIPEKEFSMASLQGHLMKYKTDPLQAVVQASSWAREELSKRKGNAVRENAGASTKDENKDKTNDSDSDDTKSSDSIPRS